MLHKIITCLPPLPVRCVFSVSVQLVIQNVLTESVPSQDFSLFWVSHGAQFILPGCILCLGPGSILVHSAFGLLLSNVSDSFPFAVL